MSKAHEDNGTNDEHPNSHKQHVFVMHHFGWHPDQATRTDARSKMSGHVWFIGKMLCLGNWFAKLLYRNKRTLLGAPGIATGNKRTLLGAPGLTTRSKVATRGSWPYY